MNLRPHSNGLFTTTRGAFAAFVAILLGSVTGAEAATARVCRDNVCDGADANGAAERGVNPLGWVWYRKMTLHVRADAQMAWASIDGGVAGDEVWIDRSWNGGSSWEGRLGALSIPSGSTNARTAMYYFDDPGAGAVGLLRACGKAGDRSDIACTPWVRSADAPPDLHRGAADVLMGGYDATKGMWGPGEPEQGIWLSANAMTALIDYMSRTGDRRYEAKIAEIAARHPSGIPNKSIEDYYDDFGWWALAWMRAYDFSGNAAYLDKAESIARSIRNQWDSVCGGGIRWRQSDHVKNTITNALYIALTASLHQRHRTDGWLAEAQKTWNWFRTGTGGQLLLGSAPGLVKDGVYEASAGQCGYFPPVGANTYTYLQGALAGGLTELYSATGDIGLLDWATGIADAATSRLITSSGVLFYDPEERDDGLKDETNRYPSDGTAFKGITVRNLRKLYDVSAGLGRPVAHWRTFLLRQKDSLVQDDRSGWTEFGMHWAGPIRLGRYITFGTQQSAVDAFNASSGL